MHMTGYVTPKVIAAQVNSWAYQAATAVGQQLSFTAAAL